MKRLSVYVDSDVVYSSLISHTGAAYFLMHQSNLTRYISNYSLQELEIVHKRHNRDVQKLYILIKNQLNIITLAKPNDELKTIYTPFVHDINDAHIIAGSVKTRAKFILTYNIKDYRVDKIKSEFGIIIYTPAIYAQYLRSIA